MASTIPFALPQSYRDLRPGLRVGHLKLLMRVNTSKKYSPSIRKRWRCECECGTRLTVPQSYFLRKNPKLHCGCKNKTNKTIYNREYRIWLMMHKRCYDPTHIAYKDYGGRGIGICEAWRRDDSTGDLDTGFERFLAHIGPAPSTKHSVDRKEVDGNYEPGNVRWATAKEQANNTRKQKYKQTRKSVHTTTGMAAEQRIH